MNKLQEFIQSLPCGFIRADQMPTLIALDRLHPCLVRCGNGRFTCGAQDVAHFIRCVEAGGDYVRDVSLPVGSAERAAAWVPEAPITPVSMLPQSFTDSRGTQFNRTQRNTNPHKVVFNESDCGGVYDGINTVYSDADSGL
jgi:hypothetical protein